MAVTAMLLVLGLIAPAAADGHEGDDASGDREAGGTSSWSGWDGRGWDRDGDRDRRDRDDEDRDRDDKDRKDRKGDKKDKDKKDKKDRKDRKDRPERVTAVEPAILEHDACDEVDVLVIAETEGVTYRIDGDDVPAGAQELDPGRYRVTAHAEDGYELEGDARWKVQLRAAEPCPDPVEPPIVAPDVDVPPPPAVIAADLQAVGICVDEVENRIEYLVGGENWTEGTLSIGGEATTVAPGNQGTVAWPMDGDLLATDVMVVLEVEGHADIEVGPLAPDVECVLVAGVIVDDTDEEPVVEPITPVAQPVTEVLGESVDALPRTGASALVLALLGLFGLGAGGAILRRRPRDA